MLADEVKDLGEVALNVGTGGHVEKRLQNARRIVETVAPRSATGMSPMKLVAEVVVL